MKGQRPEQGVPVSIHRARGFRLYLIHHKLEGGMEEETPRSSSPVPASSCTSLPFPWNVLLQLHSCRMNLITSPIHEAAQHSASSAGSFLTWSGLYAEQQPAVTSRYINVCLRPQGVQFLNLAKLLHNPAFLMYKALNQKTHTGFVVVFFKLWVLFLAVGLPKLRVISIAGQDQDLAQPVEGLIKKFKTSKSS